MLNRRRIAYTLGAAAGGLLGAALAPAAAAFADDLLDHASPITTDGFYTVTPNNPETITGIYNMTTAPPGVNESIQGYQSFDVANGGTPLGTVYGYESTAPYLAPHIDINNSLVGSQVLYVDSGVANLLGETPGTNPLPDGSVISTTWSGGGTLESVYSAIPGAGGAPDKVTDILVNTVTGQSFDLSWLVNGLGFDAANVTPALPSYITGIGDPVVTAVNGLPPLTIALQGTQHFDYNPTDGPGGTFGGLETTTTDGLGFHTEAILVTKDVTGGAPAVGSVFNTIDWHNLSNVYSSIPQGDGTDKVTDILTNTQTGQTIDLSSLFQAYDASKGLTDGTNIQPFDFGGNTIAPDSSSPEVFTGINGLPPGNASIQGVQDFLVTDANHAPAGSFTADVTTIPQMWFSNNAESLLVTDSQIASIPNGSVFDIQSYGFGFENIYADLATGSLTDGTPNTITDTLVTPLGNLDLSWLYQSLDAANGLNPSDGLVSFLDAAWLDLIHLF